jgi:hypothetical protein
MALQKNVHSVPLSLGVDTKDNPVLVGEDRWQLLENAVFSKGPDGQIHTRNGYARLQQFDTAGNPITNGQSLAQLGAEFDLIANGELYALAPSQEAWSPRARLIAVVPNISPVVTTNYNVSAPDSATVAGVTAYAWVDQRGGVWFKVVDQQSGTTLHAEAQLDSTAGNPRVIINQANLAIFYSTAAGNLKVANISTSAPGATPTPANVLGGGVFASSPFEVVTLAANFAVVYLAPSTGYVAATTLAFGSLTPLTTVSGVLSVQPECFNAAMDGAGNLIVGVASFSFGFTVYRCLNPTTLANIETVQVALAGPAPTALVVAPSATTPTTVSIFVQYAPGASLGFPTTLALFVQKSVFDEGSTSVVTDAFFLGGVGLVSSSLACGGVTYLLIVSPSTIQQTYFLVTTAGTIVGRFIALNAGPFPPQQRFAHAMVLSLGVFGLAVTKQVSFTSAGGKAVAITGLALLTLDFTQTNFSSGQLGQDLTLSGGLPQLYDGEAVFENGFNLFPEAVTVTLLTSQIGLTAWTDGAAGVNAQFTLTFPINPDGSGQDGQLISDLEYLTFAVILGSVTRGWVFNVDETGGLPPGAGSGVGFFHVVINSFDSAAIIAAKFAAAFGSGGSGGPFWTTVVTGNSIVFTSVAALQAIARPFLDRQMEIAQIALGTSGSAGQVFVNAIKGELIQPGQFFTFETIVSGAPTLTYVWFTISGIGTDPKPFGSTITGQAVNILVTDSESQVATKIAAQLTTPLSPVATGPFVIITNTTNGAVTLSPSSGNVGAGMGTVGPAVAAGQFDSYEYCETFEALDAQGQLHRSAPSIPTQIKFPAYGYANAQVQVTLDTLRLTARPAVDLVLYRTAADGTLFYRQSSPTSLIRNDTSVASLPLIDRMPDATLIANELLYTTGGVLPNNCPPAFTQLANFQDQLWINDAEDPQLWWFSKSFQNGVAVEFSLAQTLRFDPIGGPTVAAAVMDSSLIVFATKLLWDVSGPGPDSTGGGLSFNGPALITTPVGLRDPGSVVLIPSGLLFKSANGFYLLTRGLQIQPLNAVDAYAADIVVSAQLIPDATEVRFLAASGLTLLYDWQFQQWSAFTGTNGVDSIVYGGAYYYLRANGAVLEEAEGYYFDDLTGFTLLGQTAWFKLAGIQGFQRLWKSFWEGLFPGSNPLRIQIAYNYDPTIVDTITLNPTAGLVLASADTFGSFIQSPYMIQDDANTVGHWNAHDLANGTAKVGPAWTPVGSPAFNAGASPRPSVGPLDLTNYFSQAPGSPINQAGNFSVVILFTPTANGVGELISSGWPTSNIGWFIQLSVPGNAGVRVSPANNNQTDASLVIGAFEMVSAGFDASLTETLIAINGNAASNSSPALSLNSSTTVATLGRSVPGDPGGDLPSHCDITEMWISTTKPTTALFQSIFAALYGNSYDFFAAHRLIIPSTLTLYAVLGGVKTAFATDDGAGNLTGTSTPTGAVTGTVNYATGEIKFRTVLTPTTYSIEADYQYRSNFTDAIQLRVFNSIQACESVQFTVQMLPPFWQSAKALGLNALDLEVGIKKGGMKLGKPVSIG